jgi:hypothetical protein
MILYGFSPLGSSPFSMAVPEHFRASLRLMSCIPVAPEPIAPMPGRRQGPLRAGDFSRHADNAIAPAVAWSDAKLH